MSDDCDPEFDEARAQLAPLVCVLHADLDRVTDERDEARVEAAAWEAAHGREQARLDAMTERAGALAGDLNAAREALASTKRERDQARAELVLVGERETRWHKAAVDAHTEVARWMGIAKAAEAALLRALGRPVEIGSGAPTSGPCAYREWTVEDEERDAPFPSGPPCGKRATHTSCVPTIGALTCDAHKCRCARPLPATETT